LRKVQLRPKWVIKSFGHLNRVGLHFRSRRVACMDLHLTARELHALSGGCPRRVARGNIGGCWQSGRLAKAYRLHR
jgi:hypothetical protein